MQLPGLMKMTSEEDEGPMRGVLLSMRCKRCSLYLFVTLQMGRGMQLSPKLRMVHFGPVALRLLCASCCSECFRSAADSDAEVFMPAAAALAAYMPVSCARYGVASFRMCAWH